MSTVSTARRIEQKAEHSLFVRNMECLWRADPKLALALDRIEEDDLPAAEPTKSEHHTLRRNTSDGRPIYLHSRYDPPAEAAKWAEKTFQDKTFCYIIEGFALGYHVRALFDKLLGDAIVVVIEPDLHHLRLALTYLDFSEVLRDRRLFILTDADKSTIHAKIFTSGSFIMMGTKIASHQPSVQLSGRFFTEARAVLMDFVDYVKTCMVTLVINAQTTCRNVACNLPTYLATPPINNLKSRFAGHPAVVVSAGPSLGKNMHLLGRAKGKAVIIATQTTFKPLLSRDIKPDFVCSLDYHEMSKRYYEGVEDFHDIHLVAEPKAHQSVIEAYGGPVSLLHNDFAKRCLGQAHAPRDGLPAGSSVAHLAFYLAEYLGCDPIIFVGQDLAFTNHVYYAPGMAIHDIWQTETNRFCTMEMKEWDRVMRDKPILRKVQDWQGREIYTEDLMFNYLEQFQKDFAGSRATIIDATEGGARKQGATNMPLAEALDQFCGKPIDSAAFAYRKHKPWFNPSKLREGRDAVQARLGEMKRIAELCGETLTVLEELRGLTAEPAKFNEKIKKVDSLRAQVKQFDLAYDIISSGAQLAELRKFTADQQLKASGAVGVDRAKRQLARDMEFVRCLGEDSERMIVIMEESVKHFDAALHKFENGEGQGR